MKDSFKQAKHERNKGRCTCFDCGAPDRKERVLFNRSARKKLKQELKNGTLDDYGDRLACRANVPRAR